MKEEFDAYFKSKMDPSEEEELTTKLIQFKLGEDKKKQWAKQLEQGYGISRAVDSSGQSRYFAPFWKWVTAFVVLLLTLLLFYFIYQGPSEASVQLASQYVTELNILQDPSVLKKGPDRESSRQLAAIAYTKGQYKVAAQLYRQLLEMEAADAYDLFYYGLSLLKAKRPEAALPLLRQSLQEGGPKEEIAWCSALAHLLQGEKDAAQEILENIVDKQAYMHKKAERLLAELKQE